ncbi:hypothetical protein COCOBI_15-4500 [Coccomyxa sp. Obi]|nr:hypothetical protein COCOBI_15-4500 [Coccomyxa sp. Obi]
MPELKLLASSAALPCSLLVAEGLPFCKFELETPPWHESLMLSQHFAGTHSSVLARMARGTRQLSDGHIRHSSRSGGNSNYGRCARSGRRPRSGTGD